MLSIPRFCSFIRCQNGNTDARVTVECNVHLMNGRWQTPSRGQDAGKGRSPYGVLRVILVLQRRGVIGTNTAVPL